MIAVGTAVTFTDRINWGGNTEPHSGRTGTVTVYDESVYLIKFPDGQTIWADPAELSAA